MIVIKSPLNETSEAGTVIQTGAGFPLAYFGKGSYSGEIEINSSHASEQTETAQLIYIGRYSAIGTEIKIFCDVDHDFRSIYMGVIAEYADTSENASFRDRWGMSTRRMKHRGMIVIGNDVWLGDNVTLVSDVTIGNGAVIGAGSVVAKDIPPYTIWCGNPAVCIGNRFSTETIDGLRKISWWDKKPYELKDMEADMKGEADEFVAKYLPLATDARNTPAPFNAKKNIITMVAFVDTETPFPTYADVVAKFIEKYCDRSAELILCYYVDSERDLKAIEPLLDIKASLEGIAEIRFLGIQPDDDESVISRANCLILGRDTKNIQRISHAFKYNVKLISGANSPMF